MDINNLSMVFGPNILKAKGDDPKIMMQDSTYVNLIMSELLTNHKYVCYVC